jgi:hypothetical protein
MSDPLDLSEVEALLRDLRGEVPTDARDVEPEDAAVAIEALLVALRETRKALYDMAYAHEEWGVNPCVCASHMNAADVLARVSDDVRSPHEAP